MKTTYQPTTWRCTLPVENGRIAVAFGEDADTAIRLSLNVPDAITLAKTILSNIAEASDWDKQKWGALPPEYTSFTPFPKSNQRKYLTKADLNEMTLDQKLFLECLDIVIRAEVASPHPLEYEANRLLILLQEAGRSQPDSTCDKA